MLHARIARFDMMGTVALFWISAWQLNTGRVVILQILPLHLVPPHAASPAIRLFLLVKRVLRRTCWWSGVEWSRDLGTMSWVTYVMLLLVLYVFVTEYAAFINLLISLTRANTGELLRCNIQHANWLSDTLGH